MMTRLLPLCFAVFFHFSLSAQHPEDLQISFVATGRTTGHVADGLIFNAGDAPIETSIGPFLLIAEGPYQPLISVATIPISLAPGSEAAIQIEDGLCVDITLPAPPDGTELDFISQEDVATPFTPATDFSKIPGFKPLSDTLSVLPKVPGYEFPLYYTIDLDKNLREIAPLLFAAARRVKDTYQDMTSKNMMETPLPPAVEQESVEQQSFWQVTSALTGNEYKKVDFEENLKQEFEQNMKTSVDQAPESVQKEFHSGADQLWGTFLQLNTAARLLNDAADWKDVVDRRTAEAGPAGVTLTTGDGTARLDIPPDTYTEPEWVSLIQKENHFDTDGPVARLDWGADPPMDAVRAPVLSFPQTSETNNCRVEAANGDAINEAGQPVAIPDYLIPVEGIMGDADYVVPVLSTEYTPCTEETPEACKPDGKMLEPPATPKGYRYVGRNVVIDKVYRRELSTAPLNREDSPEDLVHIRSKTEITDHKVECEVIVTHVFKPLNAAPDQIEVPEDMLEPPPAPEGYEYAGREVVVNHAIDTDLSNTADNLQIDPDKDLVYVNSKTIVKDGCTDKDIIVVHVFKPKP
jgi:hypothetical protein